MITETQNFRLKHAFNYADKLQYTSYYDYIVGGIKVKKEVYDETLQYFINTEEYELCAKMKEAYEKS